MKTTTLIALALTAGFAAGASSAEAKQIRYVGAHPVPAKAGGGACYVEAPHVHVYLPSKPEVLYRVHDGDYYFVGDPVATASYDGPRHSYYGHHPIYVDALVDGASVPDPEPEFCYLDGPHYHAWEPPTGTTFTLKGDAYWYLGAFPAPYRQHKKRYVAVNAYYQPIAYVRPVVVVDPPIGYLGPVVEIEAPMVEVVAPDVQVRGPAVSAGIEVHIPVPTFEIGIGLPGLIVEDHHHHVHDWSCGHDGHSRGHRKAGKHKRGGKHGGFVRVRDHR